MGVFKKARKKRISNKITKLNGKITELEGEGMGVFLPDWKEGGKDLLKTHQKVWKLQEKLDKMNVGGKIPGVPGMYQSGGMYKAHDTTDIKNITDFYNRGTY